MLKSKIRQSFLQGKEDRAHRLRQDVLRREGVASSWEAMSPELDALCSPRFQPEAGPPYLRARQNSGDQHREGRKVGVLDFHPSASS
jgi:hypothetical protein